MTLVFYSNSNTSFNLLMSNEFLVQLGSTNVGFGLVSVAKIGFGWLMVDTKIL